MRKQLFLSSIVSFILLCFCFVVLAEADSTTIWNRTYGGTEYEEALSMVETLDGGYALAGYTASFGAGGYDFWLVKTDASGNMQWNRTYGGTGTDCACSLVKTSDGGYAIAGYTYSFDVGGSDFWLVKTNEFGNVEWNQTYGGIKGERAYSLVETGDGGYALAGYTYSLDVAGDFWLVKTDEFGKEEWNQHYGGAGVDFAYSLVESSDRGYAVAGITRSFGDDYNAAFWLVKTDEFGKELWNKTYGMSNEISLNSMVATSDGGYAVAGSAISLDGLLLVKTDGFGDIEWNKTYEGTELDLYTSLVETSDGGYAVAGNANASGAGAFDFCLVKINSFGNMQWKETYGGTEYDYASSVLETSDGKYALLGLTYSFGSGDSDFWLVKTDGCVDMYEFVSYEFDYSYGYGSYVVVVSTNSTLGNFDFGIGQNQIRFTVTGPTGTTGVAKIIIPEDLTGGDFPVYLNEFMLLENVDYTRTYNGTHTIIDMTYSHSTHLIEITGTNVIPEYSSWLIPTVLMAATMCIVIYKKRLSN